MKRRLMADVSRLTKATEGLKGDITKDDVINMIANQQEEVCVIEDTDGLPDSGDES